jgi:hypothetical protein
MDEDSVADIAMRKEKRGNLPSIKNVLILAIIAFATTSDRVKAAIITLMYFILSGLFA